MINNTRYASDGTSVSKLRTPAGFLFSGGFESAYEMV